MHAKIREKFYMNMNTTALPVSNKLFYSCFIKAQELKKLKTNLYFKKYSWKKWSGSDYAVKFQ